MMKLACNLRQQWLAVLSCQDVDDGQRQFVHFPCEQLLQDCPFLLVWNDRTAKHRRKRRALYDGRREHLQVLVNSIQRLLLDSELKERLYVPRSYAPCHPLVDFNILDV